MKTLVTGATGFIGQRLCALLDSGGHEVIPLSGGGGQLPDGTPTTALDFSRETVPAQILEGVETVFHLAGLAHRNVRDLPYDAVNHRAVRELARAARDAGVRCFVFLSSVKAMGLPDSPAARREDEVVVPRDPYGLSKWRAEEGLREEMRGAGMALYILRPSLVYADHARGNLRLLERLIALGLPQPPELGARSMVSRDDLVELMLKVAEQHAPGIHTWNVTDGEHYSTRRIYAALRRQAGKPPASDWLPAWAWRAGVGLVDRVASRDEPYWRKLFGTELYCNRRAREESGWSPRLQLEDVFAAAGAGQC